MLEIKTNQLKTRKRVLIDDHEYIVRRLGNIEQLEISQLMRKLDKLATAEKTKSLTSAQLEEVDDISRQISDIFISLFDDGDDQTKSKTLVGSLSDSEISLLLDQIFEEKDDTTEAS